MRMAVFHSLCITLDTMRFHAYHGVLPQERIVGGDYEVCLTLRLAHATSAATDDLADTVNYAEAYEVVAEVMRQPSDLIERVAGRILTAVLERFAAISSAQVSIAKVAPPMMADLRAARVTLVAEREPA